MGADNGKDGRRQLITLVKKGLSRLGQGVERKKEFTMRNGTAEMAPKHFNRIEPRAIGRQV